MQVNAYSCSLLSTVDILVDTKYDKKSDICYFTIFVSLYGIIKNFIWC